MTSAKTQSGMYRTLAFLNERGEIGAARAEVRDCLGLPKARGHASRKDDDQRAAEALMGAIHGAMTARFRGWLRTDGGRWFLTPAGIDAARHAPPRPRASVGVAGSYADLQARAIAAEDRAQGLAEQLAEERTNSKRHLDLWTGCCDSFEQLHHVRVRLTKKARRMRARLQELEAILADIDTIKDPTIPF